jgi:hypothetical protein
MDSYTFIYKISNDIDLHEDKYKEELLKETRKSIYLFLISRSSEDDYIDLCTINKKYKEYILSVIGDELTKAGWKWQLSFGDTGMFIFKGDVPKTCW